MSSSRIFKQVGSGLVLAVIALGGCGTDVSEIASSVKDAATQGLDKAKQTAGEVGQSVSETAKKAAGKAGEKIGMAGSFELHAGQSLTTDACYARCIALGQDRPAILQLQSYQDAETESFPSVFVRAEVIYIEPASLVGKTFEAQLFIKRQQNEATLYSRDAPVQLRIDAIDEGLLVGQILSGSLSSSDTSETTPVSGSFRGVVR